MAAGRNFIMNPENGLKIKPCRNLLSVLLGCTGWVISPPCSRPRTAQTRDEDTELMQLTECVWAWRVCAGSTQQVFTRCCCEHSLRRYLLALVEDDVSDMRKLDHKRWRRYLRRRKREM